MDKLEIDQPIPDKFTGKLKKIVHRHFEIKENLEMRQVVDVVFYENVNGKFGRPMLQVIEDEMAQGLITVQERKIAMAQFKTVQYESETGNSFVNPETGQMVEKDNEGNYPEGSIPELIFWQNLPEQLFASDEKKTLAGRVYSCMLFSMQRMIDRKRI